MAERRVHPNCIYKSNPYHECIESCFEKMAQGKPQPPKKKSVPGSLILVVPKRLSFRKKKGSELRASKSLDAEPDLKSSLDRPDSPASPVQFSFKKVESWNCDPSFTKPYAEKDQLQDASFLKFLPKPKLENETPKLPSSPVESKPASQDHNEEEESIQRRIFGSMSSNNTVTVTDDHSTEASDVQDSQVPVGNYYVKESVASILSSILGKYGDVAEDCRLESVAMRCYYLESVCFMIHELQTKPVSQMNEPKLKEMLAIVKDAETVGINVGWLSPVVERIGQVLEHVRQQKAIETEKKGFNSTVESTRKELEQQLQDLAEKEKEVAAAKARVDESRGRLRKLEEECSRLNEAMMSIKSKVESVDCKSMISEIL